MANLNFTCLDYLSFTLQREVHDCVRAYKTHRVIKGCGIDHHEVLEVVLVGRIVTMPTNHIKRRVALNGGIV